MTAGMFLLVIIRVLVDFTLLGYPNKAVGVAEVVEKVFFAHYVLPSLFCVKLHS